MPKRAAGILMYRRMSAPLEVLLVHPGGPLWAKKDDGAWSIPKGLYEDGEQPEAAARREFQEETGGVPSGELLPLGAFKQPGGKVIEAWAVEGNFDVATLTSNTFPMEWPPRSGRMQEFPEVDRAAWFAPDAAAQKVVPGQRPILQALAAKVGR